MPAVRMLDARDWQCRFPVSEKPTLEMLVCGKPVKTGSSFCPACHSVVYIKTRPAYSGNPCQYSVQTAVRGEEPAELTGTLA